MCHISESDGRCAGQREGALRDDVEWPLDNEVCRAVSEYRASYLAHEVEHSSGVCLSIAAIAAMLVESFGGSERSRAGI